MKHQRETPQRNKKIKRCGRYGAGGIPGAPTGADAVNQGRIGEYFQI